MACPPVSAPSCREDQFLVEVRGEKPCCYSYLCGTFLKQKDCGVRLAVCHVFILNISDNYSNKTEVVACVFSLSSV